MPRRRATARAIRESLAITKSSTLGNAVEADQFVKTEAVRTISPTDGVIYQCAVSKSNALPELPGETVTDLALIEAFEQIKPHANIVAGAWPQVSDAEPYEVAISEPAAAVPGVIVIYPRISLEPAVTAVLVLILVVMMTVLRRIGLGTLLRIGEE